MAIVWDNCCGCGTAQLNFRWSRIWRSVQQFPAYYTVFPNVDSQFNFLFFGYDSLTQHNNGVRPAIPPDSGNDGAGNDKAYTWNWQYGGLGRVLVSTGYPHDFYPAVTASTFAPGAPPGAGYYGQNATPDQSGERVTGGTWGASPSQGIPSQGNWNLANPTQIGPIWQKAHNDVLGVNWPLDWSVPTFERGYNDYAGATANPTPVTWDGSLQALAAPIGFDPPQLFDSAAGSGWSIGGDLGVVVNFQIFRGQIRLLGNNSVQYEIGRYRATSDAADGHAHYQIDLVSSGTLVPVNGVVVYEIGQPPSTPFGPGIIGSGNQAGTVRDDYYFIAPGGIGTLLGGVGFHTI